MREEPDHEPDAAACWCVVPLVGVWRLTPLATHHTKKFNCPKLSEVRSACSSRSPRVLILGVSFILLTHTRAAMSDEPPDPPTTPTMDPAFSCSCSLFFALLSPLHTPRPLSSLFLFYVYLQPVPELAHSRRQRRALRFLPGIDTAGDSTTNHESATQHCSKDEDS